MMMKNPPLRGNITILQPQQGQKVEAHSVGFAISLEGELNQGRLQMFLNGTDISSHLRKQGSNAEGFISGLVPGLNTVVFMAPRS